MKSSCWQFKRNHQKTTRCLWKCESAVGRFEIKWLICLLLKLWSQSRVKNPVLSEAFHPEHNSNLILALIFRLPQNLLWTSSRLVQYFRISILIQLRTETELCGWVSSSVPAWNLLLQPVFLQKLWHERVNRITVLTFYSANALFLAAEEA